MAGKAAPSKCTKWMSVEKPVPIAWWLRADDASAVLVREKGAERVGDVRRAQGCAS
jgi:hypothetical protein